MVNRAAHPTIATIAQHMGLSRATVTHVLNGRATEQRISPETQQRVLEVAQQLGYRANASARAIRAGRYGSVALIQSLMGQYLPSDLLYGLSSAIASKDLSLVLTEVPNLDDTGEGFMAHTMRELAVDGILVNRHGNPVPVSMQHVLRLNIPAVYLNVRQDFDSVYPDDLSGSAMATEYLLRLGHKRIAYVQTGTWPRPHYSEQDRRSGYTATMAAAGLTARIYTLPIDWRDTAHPTTDMRVECALRLLQGPDRPTAVLAYELTESMAVVRAALQLGLRIPEDLSLAHFHCGYDDRSFVPIHTVCNVMREVGQTAVAMLIDKINDPEQPIPSRAIPEFMLEGATCMPPNPSRNGHD